MRGLIAIVLGMTLFGQARLRPPSTLPCSRDHLTSFTGVVSNYSRGPDQLRLTVKTDESTTEKFTLRYKRGQDVAQWFLFARERFEANHWAEIEKAPGQLKPGARATVWVCEGGAQPVVDWEAPRR